MGERGNGWEMGGMEVNWCCLWPNPVIVKLEWIGVASTLDILTSRLPISMLISSTSRLHSFWIVLYLLSSKVHRLYTLYRPYLYPGPRE